MQGVQAYGLAPGARKMIDAEEAVSLTQVKVQFWTCAWTSSDMHAAFEMCQQRAARNSEAAAGNSGTN